jgi:hypothetical protein
MGALYSYERENFEDRIADLMTEREEFEGVISDVIDILIVTDCDDVNSLMDGITEAVEMLKQFAKGLR